MFFLSGPELFDVARSFNGTSDVISAGSHSVLQPAAITISCWVYVNSIPGSTYTTFVSLENSANTKSIYYFGLSGSANGKIAYYFANSAAFVDPGTNVLSTNTWYNVITTYTTVGNAGLATFLNGVSDGATNNSTALGTSTEVTTFGAALEPTFALGHNGSLADVAIWNVVLSSAEITALSKGTRPYTIRPTALAGYWPLDGLQSPEPDLSGNANNGTLTGTALASGPPIALFTPRWPLITPSTVPAPPFNSPIGLASCEW